MKPLEGKRVLVTRAAEQAGALSQLLRDAGAEPLEVAAIAIAPPEDVRALESARARASEYAWIAFTSANGVRGFFGGVPVSVSRAAAVGEATARELQQFGVRADLVAADATGEALGRALVEAGARGGARVLVARAQEGRRDVVDVLAAAGARVDEVATHRTVPAADAEARAREAVARGLHAAVFMSPSAVRAAGPALRGTEVVIACIGPISAEAAEEVGLRPAVVPKTHTAEALVEALCAHFSPPR